MKSFGLTGMLLLAWAQACAQGGTDPASIQVERTRILVQRQRELTRYAQEEQACTAKFFANDCVAGVKKRRRETLADLQRQEIALNDAERRRKAVQQLEQRQTQTTQAAASPPDLAASKGPAAVRLQQKTQDKVQTQQQSEAAAQARARAQAQKKKEHEEQDAAVASKAALAAKNQQQYQKKRDEAAQHKADLLERQKAKTKPAASPLPDPP